MDPFVLVGVGAALVLAIIICVPVILVSRLDKKRRAQVNTRWQSLAERLNLQFTPAVSHWLRHTPPVVEGSYRGRRVRTDQVLTTGGTLTRLVVHSERDDRDWLAITRQGRLGSMLEIMRGLRRSVGDREFDMRFYVRSSTPEFASRLLKSEDLRARLRRAAARLTPNIHLDNTGAAWLAPYFRQDPEVLAVALDALCDLAGAAEEAAGKS